MSTGTGNLPYPGKSYTPFDILTAEELNEDVANIESLADGTGIGDGSIDTVAIADEAVTASKIDFATFPGAITSSTTSITVPAGSWLIVHQVRFNQVNVSADMVYVYSLTDGPQSLVNAYSNATSQNYYTKNTDIYVYSGVGKTLNRTNTSAVNVSIAATTWIAIPLFNVT